MEVSQFVPAIAQGALGIECRMGDVAISSMIDCMNDPATAVCVAAERAVNRVLGGSCYAPIGAYACIHQQQLDLCAVVANIEGTVLIEQKIQGEPSAAVSMGEQLGEMLIQQGANQLWNSQEDL